MKRFSMMLLLGVLAIGCSKSNQPNTELSADKPGKPTTDEARLCIADYMNQCGWKNVEFATFNDQANLPSNATAKGDAWAYQFSATYQNIFGESQKTNNWVAVVTRDGSKVKMLNCFDEHQQLVGGHSGQEESEKAKLTPMGAADINTPAIIAPKP